MKPKISYLIVVVLINFFVFVACSKDDSLESTEIGEVVEIFEMKYGEIHKTVYNDTELQFQIESIEDTRIDCSVTDFVDNVNDPKKYRIQASLQINENQTIQVKSLPCGPRIYKGNGQDINEIEDWIENLNSFSNITYASKVSTFFHQYGEGTHFFNNQFKIYLPRATSLVLSEPDAPETYDFVFILTKI